MQSDQLDSTPHDWLQNLDSVIEAGRTWRDGSYKEDVAAHYYCEAGTPFNIVCGVGLLAAHVRKFKFTPKVIAMLGRLVDQRGINLFDESFLNHLQRLQLRLEVNMPQEGTLLLPEQPVAIVKGNKLQVLLIKSAIEELIGRSTYWASRMAFERWQTGDVQEVETPAAPQLPANRSGWRARAMYIGGGSASADYPTELDHFTHHFVIFDQTARASQIGQIRRLFQANIPLADVQMTDTEDARASVSQTSAQVRFDSGEERLLSFTRFMKLYQPVLVKGHPVLASPQLAIRRQRTLHQMQAFKQSGLEGYPICKMVN